MCTAGHSGAHPDVQVHSDTSMCTARQTSVCTPMCTAIHPCAQPDMHPYAHPDIHVHGHISTCTCTAARAMGLRCPCCLPMDLRCDLVGAAPAVSPDRGFYRRVDAGSGKFKWFGYSSSLQGSGQGSCAFGNLDQSPIQGTWALTSALM